MPFTYILYSSQLDRHYIGSTEHSMELRLEKHLSKHKGFTSKAKDWMVVYLERFETLKEARQR